METVELIENAAQRLRPHRTAEGRVHGDVAAAVLSGKGTVHVGVCVDAAGWGRRGAAGDRTPGLTAGV
jgi:hypothetical protein